MSKGVVVQLEHNTAYIMRNNGAFVSCPRNPNWRIGDVVTIKRHTWFSLRFALISCAALLILFIGMGAVVYNIPVSYIEVSVNPSVQMTLNRFERVLNVTGLNEEGHNLLQGISYKNLTLEEAYARLFNRLENNGYLNEATVQLVIVNNSQRKLDGIEQTLWDISVKYLQTNNIQMSIKRYANDEYLDLPHPLPIVEIPASPGGEPSEPLPDTTPSESLVPDDAPNSKPSESTEDTPIVSPSEQPSLPPSNNAEPDPTTPPSNTPNNGNWHNGGWNRGNWHNGWWDWDCN